VRDEFVLIGEEFLNEWELFVVRGSGVGAVRKGLFFVSAILTANALITADNLTARIHCVDTWQGSSEHQSFDFVRQDEIDSRYFETPYYLLPAKGGDKPYALLREAMRQTGVVGIGKVIIRRTQHLAGVRVVGEALVIELMRFANELVDISDYSFPGTAMLREQELTMAKQLVENLAEPFDPSRYTDDYRANLMKLIRAKMKGKKVTAAEPLPDEDEDSKVLDLMSRLQASLEEAAKEGTGGKKRVSKTARRASGSRSRQKKSA